MTPGPRTVTVLGSTGSVGTQTVELLSAQPERFEIRALVGGRNVALLAEQAVALVGQVQLGTQRPELGQVTAQGDGVDLVGIAGELTDRVPRGNAPNRDLLVGAA